jgi:hypothetical protein
MSKKAPRSRQAPGAKDQGPAHGPMPSMEQMIPLGKVRANIARAHAARLPDLPYQFIVLIGTGSFSPVHRMHVAMFELSRAYFERNPCTFVVGGFLSPSHDHYVSFKLQDEWIPGAERCAMIRAATRESDWLDCVRKLRPHTPSPR